MASDLKKYFVRGLTVMIPTVVTLWVFIWAYRFIQDSIGRAINEGIILIMMTLNGIAWTDTAVRDNMREFWVRGWGSLAGFIIALIIVFFVGLALANVIGRRLWRYVERLMGNIPGIRRVYPYVKQVSDFLLSQKEKTELFSRVVAVEFPRKGVWCIGFVTGGGMKRIIDGKEVELLSIIVPTAPSPLTGFLILLPREDTVSMNMTVEEALRMVISDGVITPKCVIDESKK